MIHSSYLKRLTTVTLLCLSQLVFAQNKVTVDGTVKDAKGAPRVGATVLEAGTLNGTSTDLDGK